MRKPNTRRKLHRPLAASGRSAAAVAVAACFTGSLALANPTAPTVVNGTASFATAGNILNITNSPNAIINWGSFSIGVNELTRFLQQSASSAVLNRVIGQDPSAILGALQSNGKVFLLNPNGIVFGAGSQINVAGLVASTLNLSNEDFLANRMRFTDGAGAGSVVNLAKPSIDNPNAGITAAQVYLIGNAVTNNGIITSPQGEVILAAGNSVELVNPGTPNLRVEIVAPDNAARNLGTITADAGRIGIYAGLINHSGNLRADSAVAGADGSIKLVATKNVILEAGSVTSASGATGGSVDVQADVLIHTGSIHADGAQGGGSVTVEARNVLSAGRISADSAQGAGGEVNIQASGRILQTSAAHLSADGAVSGGKVTLQAGDRVFGSGTLTASGTGAGSTGGEIKVLGNDIVLLGARIDASGDAGGGTILIGGDFQGNNPAVQNATTNWINFSTTINADARTTGDGGKVIVWSDQETQFYGTISARGGAQSGDGGFIEVSGKENLVFGGMADAGAPNGKPGTLLLDPKFIIIDSAGGGGGLTSFLLVDPNPGAGHQFAQQIVVLPNNNVVATDPLDDLVALNAGAVYLFNGASGALISTLTGSTANDFVGAAVTIGDSITVLSNGNYVVRHEFWNNSGVSLAGAVTFGNGATGFIGGGGPVSASNSLVGTTAGDTVGFSGVTALSNGNYVVGSHVWDNVGAADAGAVTFGNGASGIVGPVTTSNSLVGTTANDQVGSGGVMALTNGNYVVRSPNWDNGAATNAGAVTFGSGTSGVSGAVLASNSLVGTSVFDQVGSVSGGGSVTALTNGNYVVTSPTWDNGAATDAGAATFGSGTAGVSGAVSASNSLVGTSALDQVGFGVTALTNGNYVVRSTGWNNGAASGAGAVTFGSGTTGVSGAVSASNSLVGTTAGDQVGGFGSGIFFSSVGSVTALTNGNYVVRSSNWDNVTDAGVVQNAGAVTFGSGTAGVSGAVSASNSLVGTSVFDQVGLSSVTALTNGNYVVRNRLWDNGAASNAGAVTFGSGTTGVSGAVSASNSLVGTTAGDGVGESVTALSNGNYVVRSPLWDNGAATNAGAVTFGSGTTGVSGAVLASNSLVGTTANDQVGNGGVTALSNGNYVVGSASWNNGTATNAGAVTFGSGTTGVSGAVSASNSLVGTTQNDFVGTVSVGEGVTALTNGNYVVASSTWDNGAATNAGAVTFGSGTAGVSGAVSASNSLVGTTASDQVGNGGVTALTNGNYVVNSQNWNNGAASGAGAVTFGSGTSGVSGAVSAVNSLVGPTANDQIGSGGVTPLSNGNVVVRSPLADNGAIVNAGLVHVLSPSGGGGFTNPLTFADNMAGTTTITPSQITAITNTGTAVILQANTDITLAVASDIITNNTGGNGGALTMQAGRSIFLNSSITTDNGAVTIVANETTANGAVDAQRDPGAAVIVMAPGTTINAGSGNISMAVGTGATRTGTAAQSGDITLANLTTTGHVLVQNLGPTAGSGIVRADVNSLITASSAAFDVNGAGLGGEIGTLLAPMRVTLTNLEARSQAGGAFFDSPTQGLTIGGATLGALTAIGASLTGAISVTAPGTISVIEGINASDGNITLAATGALSDINIFDANGGAAGSGGVNTLGGAIVLNAGQDVIHTGGANQINTSGGAMNITAVRDILHTGSTTNQINSSSGVMLLQAGRDIFHSGGASQINNSSGSLTLIAGQDIIHSGNASQINTSSGALTLQAGRDIVHDNAGQINTGGGAMLLDAVRDFKHIGTANQQINVGGSGTMTINAGQDFIHSSSSRINASGTMNINVGRDFLYFGAGGSINSNAMNVAVTNNLIMSGNSTTRLDSIGPQTIAVGNDLSLSNGSVIRGGGAQNISVVSNASLNGSTTLESRIDTNDNQLLTVGGNLTAVNAGIRSFGASQTLDVGGNLTLIAVDIPTYITSVAVNTTQSISVGVALTLQGGAASGASAEIRSNGIQSIVTGSNLALLGGSGLDAFSGIIGNPDVGSAANPVTVGGVIRMDAGSGSGAYAAIESVSPTTIYVYFPNLASGGYFVNGVEGTVYDAATGTGFIAGVLPAILDTNLLVTYGLTAGGSTLAGAALEVPTQILIVAMGESITPPEPEKDKNIFEDIRDDRKNAPLCR